MFGFSVEVDGFDTDNEQLCAGVELLPFDTFSNQTAGKTYIDVEIDAVSPQDAVLLARDGLSALGLTVVRLDLDLVSVADIAERVEGGNRETVRLWALGRRRADFPRPFTIASESKLWAWSDVHAWLGEQEVAVTELYPYEPLPLQVIESFNGAFAVVRSGSSDALDNAFAAARSTSLSNGHVAPVTHLRGFQPTGTSSRNSGRQVKFA